jgi:hypothetical protein
MMNAVQVSWTMRGDLGRVSIWLTANRVGAYLAALTALGFTPQVSD